VANLTFRFGQESSLNGKDQISSLTASMLNTGTTTKTRQAIQDELDQLKARISIFGGRNSTNVRIETTREHLPAVIKLASDMLKNPAFDPTEFDKLKEAQLSSLEESLSEPQAIANNIFSKMLSPYDKKDIRYVMTPQEEIEAIKVTKLEDLKQFHKTFYGASNATVAVVGDFDEAAVKDLIKKEFENWKSPSSFKRIDNPFIPNKTDNVNIETPDKANSMFFAGMNIKMNDAHPDYPAMLLGNYMLGGGFLNSRLATRIRQKDGLSYGVGSFFSAGSLDESATLGAYAIYAPENKEALEKAFREEIEKVQKEGFTKEEIEAAKSGWLQSRTVTRSQDPSLMSSLNSNLYLDRTMQWDAALEDKIAKLTPEQINAAMKKHIDLNKMTFVKAGDFAGAEKKKSVKP
jgi:zinc protease